MLVTSPMGLGQRSPTPDEELQGQAERELPELALATDSDAANGRHQGAKSSLGGCWRAGDPCMQGWETFPRLGISNAKLPGVGCP